MDRVLTRHHLLIVSILLIIYAALGWYFFAIESGAYDASRGFPILNGGDSEHYAFLTENMLEHAVFSSNKAAPFEAETFRSPGYPAFLVPILLVFRSFIPAIVIQVVLVIISAILVYTMGRRFYSERFALGAALVFGLSPAVIFYTFTILSDILYLFLFLLAIYFLFFRTLSPPRFAYLSLSLGALLLGYSTLVRPAGLYSIAIILPFMVFVHLRQYGLKKAFVFAAIVGIIYASALTPWYLRNYYATGNATLSSIGPYTLLFYNVAGFLGHKSGRDTDSVKDDIRGTEFPTATRNDLQSGRYTDEMNAVTVRYVQEDPVGYGVYHALGSINFFLASSLKDISNESARFREFLFSSGFLRKDQVSIRERLNTEGILGGMIAMVKAEPLFTLERGLWLIVSLSAIIAPLLFWKDPRRRTLMLLFLFLIGYFALIFGPVSYPRYRIVGEPFIFLLAAGSFATVLYAGQQLLQAALLRKKKASAVPVATQETQSLSR